MKKVNEIILTDMMDCTIVPQMVGRMIEEYDKEQDRFICKTLTELNIDENILANQAKEIQRLNNLLQEYKDLEEQGLLLRLPCKVGDTVYRLSLIGRDNTGKLRFKIKEDEFGVYQLTAIGTVIFLTREEAEAKLKEMEV